MRRQWGNSEVAKLIVEDTIRAAHTDPNLEGDTSVTDCLNLLDGPNSGQIVQHLIATHALSEAASLSLGIVPMIDVRIFNNLPITLTANGFERELKQQLTDYLELPPGQRAVVVQGLIGSFNE